MDKYFQQLKTSIGTLTLVEDCKSRITGVYLKEFNTQNIIKKETKLLKKLKTQLKEYFNGKRKNFNIIMKQEETNFQKKVYEALKSIEYGSTLTYKEVASLIDNEKASRAVGNALSKNNLLILVPCHRVVSKGSLGGFTGGIKIKKQLLNLEGSLTYG